MATVNTKMIQARYRVTFDAIRKTCGQLLGPIREFFTRVGEKKKSDLGMKNTCDQIEGLFGEFYLNVTHLKQQHEILKETCSQSAFEGVDNVKNLKRVEFSRKLDQLFKYVEHFQNKITNQSYLSAAESVVKHRAAVVASIDVAKKLNTEVAAEATKWVNSERFVQLAKSDDCYVAIRKGEITGTKKEVEEYLARRDPSMLEEIKREKKKQRKFLTSDTTIVHEHDAENGDGDDLEDEDLDDEEALARKFDKPDEDVVVDEDESASESAEFNEDYGRRRAVGGGGGGDGADASGEGRGGGGGGGQDDDDDESGEMSHGAVLFESNIEKNNAHVIRDVEATSIVHNGRHLRQRKYEKLDLDQFGHLLEKNQVYDNRKSSSTSSRAKRKRSEADEEADGSEMSSSSSSDIADAVFSKAAALAAQREQDAKDSAIDVGDAVAVAPDLLT